MDFTQFSSYDGHEPIGAALPEIPIKKQYYAQLGLPEDTSNKELLRVLCRRGVKERLIDKKDNKKVYYDQIKFELESFEEMGMVDYILALWDIINFCKEEDVLVGRGRGSAASSLVLYCLGVTGIDPIKHKLFFERFISKDRIKKVGEIDGKSYFDGGMLPDVDLDIDYADRHKVITYLEQNYKGKSSKIITFNTYSLKLCIREVCKFFLKYNEEQADRISNLIPKLHGNVANIDEAIELNEEFKKWASQNEYAIKQTRKIEGLIKNAGCHPSGIAISYEDINSIMPMQKTKDGDLIASYDMEDVAELAIKLDLLGLKSLTLAKNVCKRVGVDIDDIDVDDSFIYRHLQDLNCPSGLFQISADTNFRVCQKVKPMNLSELSDVISIARPGALAALDEYVKQKENFEPLGMHPKLDEILAETKNVLLFQEQGMSVIREVFKMQPIDAESLRKVIGKKQREKIPFWKDKIYKQGEKIKLDKKVIDYFWDIVEASASLFF
jgi:DNA polymerase III subunit alpha